MCSLKYWQTSFKNHTREKTGILKAERLRDALLEVGMSCPIITNVIQHDDGNRDAKEGCGFCQTWIYYALESVITFIVMTGTSMNYVLGVYCKSLCFHILLLVLIFTMWFEAQFLTREKISSSPKGRESIWYPPSLQFSVSFGSCLRVRWPACEVEHSTPSGA